MSIKPGQNRRKRAAISAESSPGREATLLKLLTNLTAPLVGGEDLPKQARRMAGELRKAFHANACAIRVLDGSDLALLATAGVSTKKLFPRVPVNVGISKEIISSRKPICIPDARIHPATGSFLRRKLSRLPFLSYAGAPMLADGQVTGIVGLYWVRTHPPLDSTEMDALQVFANNIAVAIINNGLYRQVNQQKEVLQEQVARREQVEEALRRSEQQIRVIIDAVPQLISYMDPESGLPLFLNKAYEHYFGRPREEISRKPIHHWIGRAAFEVVRPFVERAVRGERLSHESELMLPGGHRRWFHFDHVPDFSDDGRLKGVCTVIEDISERKQTEAGLVEREALMRLITDAVPVLISHADKDHRAVYLNKAYEHYFRRPRSEMLGKLPEEVIGRKGFSDVREQAEKAWSGEKVDFETAIQLPGGITRHFHLLHVPDRGPDGEVRGVSSFVEDITQRKVAEAALRESEKQIRLITDSLPVAICYVDRTQRLRFVNPAYCRLLGFEAEKLVGRRLQEVLRREAYKQIRKWLLKTLAGRVVSYEIELAVKPGEPRHYRVEYVPDMAADGTAKGFVALIQDITERTVAEQALRESEERYRSVVEDQTEFIVRWKPNGFRTFVNESYCRYYGRKREELIGRSFLDLVAEPDREMVRRKVASFSPDHPVLVDEHRVILPDGRVGWNEWADRAIFDQEGRIIEFQSVGRDITERKRLQEQLIQAQKMESIGTLAGGIAHDFGNLLEVIIGCASLVKRQPGLSAKGQELLDDILLASERGAAFTQQLLAYARGAPHLRGPEDLNALIRSVVHLAEKRAPRRIAVKLDLEKALPAVPVGHTQIEQVLMNLCLNAIEANSGGRGAIELKTQRRRLKADAAVSLDVSPGEYVRIDVRDHGRGMDEVTVRRMFDPFFTTKPMGRGMGLAAALGIVRDHHGQIRVESTPGKGTTVSVWLPISEASCDTHS